VTRKQSTSVRTASKPSSPSPNDRGPIDVAALTAERKRAIEDLADLFGEMYGAALKELEKA